LSEPELDVIRDKAKAAGCSLNGYVRASVLGADYKPPVDPKLRQTLLGLNLELNRQGNNLNQIARHLNGGTPLPVEGEKFLGSVGQSLIQTHSAIRNALSQGGIEEG
jgi:hypothetical protein